MGCCYTKQINPEEIEALERAAREEELQKRREEEEKRRMEEERREAERRRLQNIRAAYQQGLDVLKLESTSKEGEKNRAVLSLAPATTVDSSLQIVGTLSEDFKTRSGDQLLSYIGHHWHKFESFKYGGWQAGLSHLEFNHDNPEYVNNQRVKKRMSLKTLPPSSPWVRGITLGKLNDITLAFSVAGFSSIEVDCLLEGVVGYTKRANASLGKGESKKIDFRMRLSEKEKSMKKTVAPRAKIPTKYSAKGAIVPESFGHEDGREVAVAFGWTMESFHGEDSDNGDLAKVRAAHKASGALFFDLCVQRWHLIRRDSPDLTVNALGLGSKNGQQSEEVVDEEEENDELGKRLGEDEKACLLFAASLRPELHVPSSLSVAGEEAFSTVYSSRECEGLYLRSSPSLTLDLMPRSLDPPIEGLKPYRRERPVLKKGVKKLYLYQRRYEYVPYVPPPSLILAHDLHLQQIDASHQLLPRETEMGVHIRLRFLVWRLFKHSHRIPSPEKSGDGENRRRFMLRRKKRVQHFHNSSKQQEEALSNESDPYYDPKAKSGGNSSMRGVTYNSRKKEEVADMSKTLAHLQMFLKALEHSERQLHLLVARHEREEKEREEKDREEAEAAQRAIDKEREEAEVDELVSLGSGGSKSRNSRIGKLSHSSSQSNLSSKRGSMRSKIPKRVTGNNTKASNLSISLKSDSSSKGGDNKSSKTSGPEGLPSPAGTRDNKKSSLSREPYGQVTQKRKSKPPPLPELVSYSTWLDNLLPHMVGTTQFNSVSTCYTCVFYQLSTSLCRVWMCA